MALNLNSFLIVILFLSPTTFIEIIFLSFLIYFIYTPRAVLVMLYTVKKKKINYIWFETFRQT